MYLSPSGSPSPYLLPCRRISLSRLVSILIAVWHYLDREGDQNYIRTYIFSDFNISYVRVSHIGFSKAVSNLIILDISMKMQLRFNVVFVWYALTGVIKNILLQTARSPIPSFYRVIHVICCEMLSTQESFHHANSATVNRRMSVK